jgi:hypothetical protein
MGPRAMAKRKRRELSWKRLQEWWDANVQSISGAFRGKPLSEWRVRRIAGPPIDFEASVRKACKVFGLDPTSAHDRNIMLLILADSHYPPDALPILYRALDGHIYEYPQSEWPSERRDPGSPGRRVKWTKEEQDKFEKDKAKGAQGPPRTTNNETIIGRLQKPDKFGPFELNYSKWEKSVFDRYLARTPRSRAKKPDRVVEYDPENVLFEEIDEVEEIAPQRDGARRSKERK